MSNIQRHKDCTMRSEIGNCLAIGGFCTSVSKEICEALQNAYTNGKHSVEVNEDAISDGAISYDYIKGYREAVQRLEKFYLGEAKARNEKDRGMTREEAIMHLDFLKDYKTPQQIEAINLAIKALSRIDLNTEQSSEVDEWIKVEDALPSKRGFHIVTIEDEYGQRWSSVARYNRMENDASNDIYRFDVPPLIGKVVAWKPLPKAFTKESEE